MEHRLVAVLSCREDRIVEDAAVEEGVGRLYNSQDQAMIRTWSVRCQGDLGAREWELTHRDRGNGIVGMAIGATGLVGGWLCAAAA